MMRARFLLFLRLALYCTVGIYCFQSIPIDGHIAPLQNQDQASTKELNHREKTIEEPKVAVLIHGCHLQAEEWENIVFGSSDLLGRVPIGIEEAINKNAAMIFWGSGASQTPNGQKESEYTFSQAIGPKLVSLAKLSKITPHELLHYLQHISYIDLEAQNTTEEVALATKECLARGICELILISSPTHIARCLQEACKYKSTHPSSAITYYARASETCFASSTPGDVVIIEPPHRNDLPKVPFYRPAKKIFQFLKNPEIAFAFQNEWEKLVIKYQVELENQNLQVSEP